MTCHEVTVINQSLSDGPAAFRTLKVRYSTDWPHFEHWKYVKVLLNNLLPVLN